ncbi:MAG: imm11 family protein [Mesorhizobium sp.]
MSPGQASEQNSAAEAGFEPSAKPRKFYEFGPDIRGGGKGHGVRIANKKALITPGLITFAPPPEKGYGFADLPEKPRLVHYPKEGKMPRDLEGLYGYLLVSERLKLLFEAVDASAFEFVDCDFTLADGSKGPHYYLADVVRVLDAVDEEASPDLRIEYDRDFRTGQDIKIYNLVGGASLVFRQDVVGKAHVFRTPYIGTIFCDDVLKSACKAADITGAWFIDAKKM